jgi:hypothetical protein
MRDSSFTVFVEPGFLNYPSIIRPAAAMAATYELKAAYQTMAMLTKRKVKVLPTSYFTREGQLLHRKYTDDTPGLRKRIDDALGVETISPGTSFSVEVLFYNQQQLFQFASLIGNMTDTAGFLIHNVINTPNYFFGINGKGLNLPLPDSQWVYCVMNVSPDRVEVFLNGVSGGAFALTAPMRQSGEKVEVGNFGFMRYFLGAISEVAINGKPLEKAQIEETWSRVKP